VCDVEKYTGAGFNRSTETERVLSSPLLSMFLLLLYLVNGERKVGCAHEIL
jgi:hypothetical protein